MITGYDRLGDRRRQERQERQVDDLHYPARGKVFRFRDLVEALALLSRIVILLGLGEVANQDLITRFDRGTYYQLGLDTTLSVLKARAEDHDIRVEPIEPNFKCIGNSFVDQT